MKEQLYWSLWLVNDKFLTNNVGQVLQFTTKDQAKEERKKYKDSQICRGARIYRSIII